MSSTRMRMLRGTLATAVFAGIGFLIACGTSHYGCGSGAGDGTFDPLDPVTTRRSGFCHWMGFPGFPTGVGKWLVVGAIYLSPALVIVGGWVVSLTTDHEDASFWSAAIAVLLCLVLLLLSTQAGVDYLGEG